MSGIEEAAIDLKQDQKTLPECATFETKDSSKEALEIALRNYVPGSKEEKRLVRKLDLWMIPMLWWMCVLCYLDRNNIVSSVPFSSPFTFSYHLDFEMKPQ